MTKSFFSKIVLKIPGFQLIRATLGGRLNFRYLSKIDRWTRMPTNPEAAANILQAAARLFAVNQGGKPPPPETNAEYIQYLERWNIQLGSPVKIEAMLADIEIIDWHQVHLILLQEELRSNPDMIKPDRKLMSKLNLMPKVPALLTAQCRNTATGFTLISLVLFTVALVSLFFFNIAETALDGQPAIGLQIMPKIIGGASAVSGTVLMVLGGVLSFWQRADTLITQEYDITSDKTFEVSTSWKDVFQVKSQGDVLLIKLLHDYALATVADNWNQVIHRIDFFSMEPKEALYLLTCMIKSFNYEVPDTFTLISAKAVKYLNNAIVSAPEPVLSRSHSDDEVTDSSMDPSDVPTQIGQSFEPLVLEHPR